MELSQQTTAIMNAIRQLPPNVVNQDSLNIVAQRNIDTGNEYIVLWVQK